MTGSVESLETRLEAMAAENARLEARVRESEARFRATIERNADAIVVVDEDGIVRFANDTAERMFGSSPDQLVGSSFGFPLVTGETTELDLRRKDQPPLVVEMRLVDSEWEGRPARLASLRDITERKEAEASARRLIREQTARATAEEAAARFRFLAECSAVLSESLDYAETLAALPRLCVSGLADWVVLYVLDEDGRIRQLDAAHADPTHDASLAALRNQPLHAEPDHPIARVMERREPLLESPTDERIMLAIAADEKHVPIVRRLGMVSLMVVPLVARDRSLGALALVAAGHERVFDDDDLALAQDLALRAALALDNARLYQDAEEANRAKSEMLAAVSHDLRAPLSSIIGYADLLMMGLPEPIGEAARARIHRMRIGANHLLYLIDQLLSFARLEGSAHVDVLDVDVRDVLGDVRAVVEPLAAERDLRIEVDVPHRPVVIATDPDKLRQVLLNLAWNAVKVTESGCIRLQVDDERDGVLIRVADTGVGIAEEDLSRIFEPFWQVEETRERSGSGAGLGLSVVQRAVQVLGGAVSVESVVGDGSTFTVRLPREISASDGRSGATAVAAG